MRATLATTGEPPNDEDGETETPQGEKGGSGMWRRGLIIAVLAILTAAVMLMHASIPNQVGNLRSLTETFLPWVGVVVLVLLALAVARRSATAVVAVALPAVVWFSLFGGTLTDKQSDGGDLTVVSHNVNDANPDPASTARALAASGAEVVALEELSPSAADAYVNALSGTYRYHSVQGTVGLWSKYRMSDTQPVGIMAWTRAMRSTIATPKGPVTVFVAHLPSVRINPRGGFTADNRDASARLLADAVRADPSRRTILVGDLNGTTNDSALSPVTSQLRSAQDVAGDGFGFTWPASFPMARIDHILVRGVQPVSSWTLPATASDHLPVAASVKL